MLPHMEDRAVGILADKLQRLIELLSVVKVVFVGREQQQRIVGGQVTQLVTQLGPTALSQ